MDIFAEVARLRKQGRKGALATIIQVQGSIPSYESSKILVRDDGTIVGTVGGGCVEADVWTAAQDVMREERPRRLHFDLNNDPRYDEGLICGGSVDIFIEPILATPTAFIFGGGHISLSVSRMANLAGFDTVVADDREAFANAERFPEASETHAGPWNEIFPKLRINNFSYIVIVTRGHKGDLDCLRWAVEEPGAIHRNDRQQAESDFHFQGTGKRGRAGAKTRARCMPPSGLIWESITPEEIAVSIIGQMIAVRRNVVPSAPEVGR